MIAVHEVDGQLGTIYLDLFPRFNSLCCILQSVLASSNNPFGLLKASMLHLLLLNALDVPC